MPLTDWQMTYNGLTFGDPAGLIEIAAVSGLADLPAVTVADRDQIRTHGRIPGDDFLGERSVTVELRIDGTHPTIVGDLARALRPGAAEAPLEFRFPTVADGRPARIGARIRNKSLPMTAGRTDLGIVTATLEFVASDPRIFDAVDTVDSVPLATGGGGLDWPALWPAAWGAVTESGIITVINAGNFDSPWEARIDGPCERPAIVNVTTGHRLEFDIVLNDGEWLDLKVGRVTTVLLNGEESRLHTLAPGSRTWNHEPGATELLFQASTPSAASLTVTSRSAWTS